jgi:hypothetical protein
MFKVNGLSEEAVKKRYHDVVDHYLKLNAALDLMRVGVDVYAERFPNDQGVAYGTLMSVKYVIGLLDQKMIEVRNYRAKAGIDPLPPDLTKATRQLIKEHYGATWDEDDDAI